MTPDSANLAASSQVKNQSPLRPSKPRTLLFMTPSIKMQRVGNVLILSFSTKNGALTASMQRNWVLGNWWLKILRCLSIILHLSNYLWQKWTTVYFSLVTQLRKSVSAISRYSPMVLFSYTFLIELYSAILSLSPFIFLIISLVSSSSNSSNQSRQASLLFLSSSSRCSFCCMTILSRTTFSMTMLFRMLPRSAFYIYLNFYYGELYNYLNLFASPTIQELNLIFIIHFTPPLKNIHHSPSKTNKITRQLYYDSKNRAQ